MLQLLTILCCVAVAFFPAELLFPPPVILISLLLLPVLFITSPALSVQAGYSNQRHIPLLVLLLFVVWYAISLSWSQAAVTTASVFYILLLMPLGALVSITLDANKWDIIHRAIITAGGILALIALYQFSVEKVQYPHPLFIAKNNFVAFLNLIILPIASYILISNGRKRLVFLGLLLTLLVTVVTLNASRGASISLVAGLVLLIYLSKTWRKQQLLSLLTFTIGGIAIGLAISHGTTATKFANVITKITAHTQGAQPINPRMDIWHAAWDMYLQHPWLGWGGGTFKIAFPAFRPAMFSPEIYNAHNDYLQTLVELGPVGLSLLLLFAGTVFFFGIRSIPRDDPAAASSTGLWAGLITLFLHLSVTSNLYTPPIALIAGLYLGRLANTPSSGRAIPVHPGKRPVSIITKGIAAFLIFQTASIALSEYYIRLAHAEASIERRIELLDSASRWYSGNDAPHYFKGKLVADILANGAEVSPTAIKNALDELDVAQALMPLRRQTYWQRAKLLQYLKPKPDRQIEENYLTVLRLNPKFLLSRVELAMILDEQGKTVEACLLLNQGLKEYYYSQRATLLNYASMLQSCQSRKLIEPHLLANLDNDTKVLQSSHRSILLFRFTDAAAR